MNSAERFEVQRIREEQDRLHHLVRNLDQRIDALARRMIESPTASPKTKEEDEEAKCLVSTEPQHPPLPPKALVAKPNPISAASVVPLPLPAFLPAESVRAEAEIEEPLELRVGTFWMSRVGMVILLTGLVFLGNYAYHRIVPVLGPWGKLSLLAFAGLLLGGVGYGLERSRESLKSFGRVLLGGGTATLYYTVYAAHFVHQLRVIESPLFGGILLLAMAGGIASFAERRRSETVAVLVILLSYYTSSINPIGGFTLFSNLLLTSAAVLFLLRHRWTRLTLLSLFGTYGSYAFWRFYQFIQAGTGSDLGIGIIYLTGYWLLFTAAVFLVQRGAWRAIDRSAFLTLNNGAFFAFASHLFASHLPGAFWMFSIGFGAVLLALASLAAVQHPGESSMDGSYLAQGITLVTTGIFARLSGPQLAMALAIESSALLAGIRRRHGSLYELAAGLCGFCAFCFAFSPLLTADSATWSIGIPVALVLGFNAWWAKYQHGELTQSTVNIRAVYFGGLALVLVGFTLWQASPSAWIPVGFVVVALASQGAYAIQLGEVGLLAQVFIPLAATNIVFRTAESHPLPWWTHATVVAGSIGLTHWWQFVGRRISDRLSRASEFFFATIAACIALIWSHSTFQGESWLIAASLIATSSLGYALTTRSLPIAIAGQSFLVLSSMSFARMICEGHPIWYATLSPIAAISVGSFLATCFGQSRWSALPAGISYSQVSTCYHAVGSILFATWAFEYIPDTWRFVFFAGIGAFQIALGAALGSWGRTIRGVLYAGTAFLMFWLSAQATPHWIDLLAIACIPFSLRISGRINVEGQPPVEIRGLLVSIALASIWLWVTRWIMSHGLPGHLTIAWTLLSLIIFSAGLALRERIYRLGGFGVLGLAMGRLFLVDIWHFDSLYRILSFMVLGCALLGLSFVYHRFADAMRKYL